MKVFYAFDQDRIVGLCEVCDGYVEFECRSDPDNECFVDAQELVEKWMDHQLHDCPLDTQ